MQHIAVEPRSTGTLDGLLSPDDRVGLDCALSGLRERLAGRRMWHVNSTATGGGVAEMLTSLLPYAGGAGADVRWSVVEGDPAFFEVTKRIHNRLHEDPGDGGPLGDEERAAYDRTLDREGADLIDALQQGDVVVLHDPQTAGLAGPLKRQGAQVLWRCHIGRDDPGPLARSTWDFLCADVVAADTCVFSRPQYAWDVLAPERVATLAPCIDLASPKNRPLADERRDAILAAAGIVPGRGNGVEVRPAAVLEDAPVPPDARLAVQVSRWDRLKDPVGLIQAFAHHGPDDSDAHLLVVGPAVDGVSDDPESAEAYAEARSAWRSLSPAARRRIHLVRIPMDDPEENATVVNAVQRRADVIVQKSLAEGFGLTVAEAMWKRRPVVASRVGGVQDQIVHGESGVLVDDPADLAAFGRAIGDLLADRGAARAMGEAAHARVCDRFLPVHHFAGEGALVDRVLAGTPR